MIDNTLFHSSGGSSSLAANGPPEAFLRETSCVKRQLLTFDVLLPNLPGNRLDHSPIPIEVNQVPPRCEAPFTGPDGNRHRPIPR